MAINDIRKQIEAKKAEIDKLQEEVIRLETLAPDKRLAEMLHAIQCRSNHTDGCGWLYEKDRINMWDGTNFAHKQYLDKARRILKAYPTMCIEDIITFIEVVK